MSKAELSMKDLFGIPSESGAVVQSGKFDNARSTTELKEALAKKSKLIQWGAVKDVLAEKTVEMLDIPVVKVLFPVWRKYQEIMEYADTEKHPLGETSLVSLAEHTVTTEHHPYLQVSYRGFQFPRIEFTLTAELTLRGIVLRIQDGKIKEIKDGTLTGKGSLLLEKQSLIEKPFGSYDLPGRFDLGDGIPLRDSEAKRVSTAAR
jgi:hypothetical protein